MIDKEDILRTLGFDHLTPMQEAMGRAGSTIGGIVLLSPTGSGKTLAYLLPLIAAVDCSLDVLQAVIIVPTRELAIQSENVLKQMKTGLRALPLYGGRPAMEEHRKIREVKPQVIFATPGRLNDHLDKENLNGLGVQLLVIDEFDKCLELGFQAEMERSVTAFKGIKRCWLTSATDAEEIPAFMQSVMPDFERLNFLTETESTAKRLRIAQVVSPKKDKLETLGELLTVIAGQPTIIFVAHRESVDRVGAWLRSAGFSAELYHGGMEQESRERALYKFRSGSANVLVSTDLAARGLDIPEVRVVIHYHLPLRAEDFTHRNGRTARWDADGAIYLIVGPEESVPDFAREVTTFQIPQNTTCKPTMPLYATIYIGRGKRDKLSKSDVLGFICKKGGLKSAEVGRIDVGPNYAYVSVLRTKLRGVLRQVSGEKIKGMKTLIEEMRR